MEKKVWNLTPLFKGDNDPAISKERELNRKKVLAFAKKWRLNKKYLTDSGTLKKALDEYEILMRTYGTGAREEYYFALRTGQDEASPELKAKYNKVEEFSKKLDNELRFFNINLSKIPLNKQKQFLKDKHLIEYRHFLEKLFEEGKHVLLEGEEKIMALKSSSAYGNWVRMTSSLIAKEEREVFTGEKNEIKNFSEILSLVSDKNKKVRDDAARAFNDILEKYSEIAEPEMNSIILNKKVDDELRNMPRPDYARHLSDDIDSKTVDVLIKSVSRRNDIPKRFYELKAKLMKVKKLEYHERNVPYGKIEKDYDFEKAVELVEEVFSKLDKKFLEIFSRFRKKGQIDVFPRKGKTNGAFCNYGLISHPTYILLNHTGQLNDVLTLAHELGHGINNELIKEKQNSINFGTPTSTAEVASTFMEDFVLETLIKDSDDETKLAIMMMKLTDYINSIFRQIACYKFEQDLHKEIREKGYLSKEEMGKIFQKNMSSYMGEYVEQSKGSENWWVYWSHIRNFFYVYSYASGLLISSAMQNFVKKDSKFIEKVKEFMSTGLSDSPKNIFLKMGINISDEKFWDRGLEEIDSLLVETEKLAKKLGKI